MPLGLFISFGGRVHTRAKMENVTVPKANISLPTGPNRINPASPDIYVRTGSDG